VCSGALEFVGRRLGVGDTRVRSFVRSLAPLLDLSDLSFPFVPVVDVDDDDGDDDNHRGGGLLLV
jgi:hypothetical protein